MSKKTKNEVKKSKGRGVVKPNREVKRQDADRLSLFDSQLLTS